MDAPIVNPYPIPWVDSDIKAFVVTVAKKSRVAKAQVEVIIKNSIYPDKGLDVYKALTFFGVKESVSRITQTIAQNDIDDKTSKVLAVAARELVKRMDVSK